MSFFMFKQNFLSVLALFSTFTIFNVIHPVSAQNNLPPIIDREIIFGNPEISSARISPDGKFIAFRKPYKGTMNVWAKRVDGRYDNARLLTNEAARPISDFFWSRDGKFVLFEKDNGGDENFNIYAVAVESQPINGAEVPVVIKFERGKEIVSFQKDVENRFYVNVNSSSLQLIPGYYQLAPKSAAEFTAYNFELKKSAALKFQTSGDKSVTGVEIVGENGREYAKKIG